MIGGSDAFYVQAYFEIRNPKFAIQIGAPGSLLNAEIAERKIGYSSY
jgi:hypothetical protein